MVLMCIYDMEQLRNALLQCPQQNRPHKACWKHALSMAHGGQLAACLKMESPTSRPSPHVGFLVWTGPTATEAEFRHFLSLFCMNSLKAFDKHLKSLAVPKAFSKVLAESHTEVYAIVGTRTLFRKARSLDEHNDGEGEERSDIFINSQTCVTGFRKKKKKTMKQ